MPHHQRVPQRPEEDRWRGEALLPQPVWVQVQSSGRRSESEQQQVQSSGRRSESEQQQVQSSGRRSESEQQQVQSSGRRSESEQQQQQQVPLQRAEAERPLFLSL
ncbi:hypothetical protein CesoFtcFv8_015083 [Champsocephalus esox]|uniref:Uncharacterized protein n=1 Tax=Champsocephalus esox TaxID=159716 RepID=A0AAN8GUT5_9TELE|nr:hypothetical protein CesoFtcFv8_015083 [Champsocephalus esox]